MREAPFPKLARVATSRLRVGGKPEHLHRFEQKHWDLEFWVPDSGWIKGSRLTKAERRRAIEHGTRAETLTVRFLDGDPEWLVRERPDWQDLSIIHLDREIVRTGYSESLQNSLRTDSFNQCSAFEEDSGYSELRSWGDRCRGPNVLIRGRSETIAPAPSSSSPRAAHCRVSSCSSISTAQ